MVQLHQGFHLSVFCFCSALYSSPPFQIVRPDLFYSALLLLLLLPLLLQLLLLLLLLLLSLMPLPSRYLSAVLFSVQRYAMQWRYVCNKFGVLINVFTFCLKTKRVIYKHDPALPNKLLFLCIIQSDEDLSVIIDLAHNILEVHVHTVCGVANPRALLVFL